MSILASPSYWSCLECGESEFWVLTDGGIMCANWPDCGYRYNSAQEIIDANEAAAAAVPAPEAP